MTSRLPHSRIYALDAMRGAAAILVALYHIGNQHKEYVPGGYLAVDFFFALSGFVIAQAYSTDLLNGMKLRQFFWKRLVRLYPLYALGTVLGFLVFLNSPHIRGLSLREVLTLCLNLCFMPSLPQNLELFPYNGPSWSLSFEMLINIAFAAILWRTHVRTLIVVAIVAGIMLISITMTSGSVNVGFAWSNIIGGFPRVTFSFVSGMLIARMPRVVRWQSLLALFPLCVLVVAIAAKAYIKPDSSALYDATTVIIVFPMIVMTGALVELPEILVPFSRFFGNMSYPIYAIHLPLIYVIEHFTRKLDIFIVARTFLELAFIVIFAHVTYNVDRLIRAYTFKQRPI